MVQNQAFSYERHTNIFSYDYQLEYNSNKKNAIKSEHTTEEVTVLNNDNKLK
jgi:hypothetical protein